MGAGALDNAGAAEVVAAAAGNGTDSTLRGLHLAGLGLTAVGDEVARLTDLQELRLECNALTRVSGGVGALLVCCGADVTPGLCA